MKMAIVRGIAVLMGVLWSVGAVHAQVTYEWYTMPSKVVDLAFTQPGQIAEILVEEGQRVQSDQVLVRLDDTVERVALEQIKAQAENKTRIEAAQAQYDKKVADYEQMLEMSKKKVATKWELENARLEKVIGELSLELAKFEQQQTRQKYEETLARLERMVLRSPIDGILDRKAFETGESADALEKVLRVVKLDPLWVEVPIPLTISRTIPLKAKVDVTLADGSSIEGSVTYKSAMADAATGKQILRVEFPNSDLRPAGENVKITFLPENLPSATSPDPTQTESKEK